MGLTASSTGKSAAKDTSAAACVYKTAALAGNPNVGKSTVFNALTNLHQHTGNWAGKTVSTACGTYKYKGERYMLVDIPGAYSLNALSKDEEVARDFICFGGADVTAVVCDATCLERNLNLVLQILEVTPGVVVIINLMDEAKRRGIVIDTAGLSSALGVPVIPAAAGKKRGLEHIKEAISQKPPSAAFTVRYSPAIENVLGLLEMRLGNLLKGCLNERWTALRLLEEDMGLISAIDNHIGFSLSAHPDIAPCLSDARHKLRDSGITSTALRDETVSCIYRTAEELCRRYVHKTGGEYDTRQLKIDRLLTRRLTGLPVMLLLLSLVFFITIKGANLPSELLYSSLSYLGSLMSRGLTALSSPLWLHDALIFGVWRVLSWVVSVMLPPMAIFFPLFTILEDLGYLPRVAFNLDSSFRRAGACGKQALTM